MKEIPFFVLFLFLFLWKKRLLLRNPMNAKGGGEEYAINLLKKIKIFWEMRNWANIFRSKKENKWLNFRIQFKEKNSQEIKWSDNVKENALKLNL